MRKVRSTINRREKVVVNRVHRCRKGRKERRRPRISVYKYDKDDSGKEELKESTEMKKTEGEFRTTRSLKIGSLK